MKKIAGLFLIMGLGFTWTAAAELPNIYIHTGVSRPMAPAEFKDTYRTGVNVGIAVGKQLATLLECDVHVSYHNATFDVNNFRNTLDPETSDQYIIDGGPAHMMSVMLRARLLMPANQGTAMRSYFYAGGGFAYRSTKDITALGPTEDLDFVLSGSSETVPAVCGGIGIEYTVETTTLFLELGVLGAFTEGDATVILPLKFGVAIK